MQQFYMNVLVLILQAGSEAFLKCSHPISFIQEALVSRPNGQVIMTCELPNVTSSDVVFHWWLIRERNHPIYTYSDVYQVEDVSPKQKAIFVNETHWWHDNNFFTQIILNTNVADYNTYECEFTLTNDQVCEKFKKIQFQDARVSMNYGKMETDVNGDQNITINIMCNINGAAGEPRFQIIFLGDDQRRIQVLDENIVLENKKYYYDGAYMALVKLPLKSRLICRVNDTRGSYDSDHGSSADLLSAHTPENVDMSYVVTIAIIVPIVLLGAFCVIIILWRRGTLKKEVGAITDQLQEGFPLLQVEDSQDGLDSSDGKLTWMQIKEITKKPVIFANDEPSTKDIQQTVGATVDSWFLAAIYSILSSKHPRAHQCIKDVFDKETDLTARSVSVKLWRYGEWKSFSVKTTLPTNQGKLYFLHSKDKNVLWSAILQKAFYRNYISFSELEFERCRHVLQQLSGGLVEIRPCTGITMNYLLDRYKEGAMTCQRKVGKDYIHYSITGIYYRQGEAIVNLYEFPDICQSTNTSKSTFPQDLIRFRRNRNEFGITLQTFQVVLHYCCALILTSVSVCELGVWEQPASNQTDDIFWTNPQFLIGWVGRVEGYAEIRVAVMQKPHYDNDGGQLSPLLQTGWEAFKIIDGKFRPKCPLTKGVSSITTTGSVEQKTTCEVDGELIVGYNNYGFIIVPHAKGEGFPVEFVLRIFIPEKFAHLLQKVFLRCLSHTANGQDHDDDDIESEGGSSYAYSEDSTSEASDTLLDGVDNEGYVVVPFSQTKPSDEVYEQEVVTPREFTFLYKHKNKRCVHPLHVQVGGNTVTTKTNPGSVARAQTRIRSVDLN